MELARSGLRPYGSPSVAAVRLTSERDRQQTEIDRLVGSIAAGVPAEAPLSNAANILHIKTLINVSNRRSRKNQKQTGCRRSIVRIRVRRGVCDEPALHRCESRSLQQSNSLQHHDPTSQRPKREHPRSPTGGGCRFPCPGPEPFRLAARGSSVSGSRRPRTGRRTTGRVTYQCENPTR